MSADLHTTYHTIGGIDWLDWTMLFVVYLAAVYFGGLVFRLGCKAADRLMK